MKQDDTQLGWHKQCSSCFCEGLCPFSVSTDLHVDAPHGGLLKVERRGCRYLGFRVQRTDMQALGKRRTHSCASAPPRYREVVNSVWSRWPRLYTRPHVCCHCWDDPLRREQKQWSCQASSWGLSRLLLFGSRAVFEHVRNCQLASARVAEGLQLASRCMGASNLSFSLPGSGRSEKFW